MELEIYFDGACENNGSPDAVGGIGWLVGRGDLTIAEGFDFLPSGEPRVTNNVAEWKALIAALSWVSCLCNVTGIEIYGDSKLVVEQFSGTWKAKSPTIAALRDRAAAIVAGMSVKPVARWIPREQNTLADALSNKGLNK